jgi:hypothetical protein
MNENRIDSNALLIKKKDSNDLRVASMDKDGKKQWKPRSRPNIICKGDLEILDKYNNEIRGLYNYFSLANNCSVLSNFGYIMQYSMYKTFAKKYRTKVKKILKKYHKNGHFSVKYRLKSGVVKEMTFYHDGFKRKDPVRYTNIDRIPNMYHTVTTSLTNRLKAEKCEMCGATGKLAMHHVRKLKELKGNNPLEKCMIARKRKTIALCGKCQKNISSK